MKNKDLPKIVGKPYNDLVKRIAFEIHPGMMGLVSAIHSSEEDKKLYDEFLGKIMERGYSEYEAQQMIRDFCTSVISYSFMN
jgi:hypothetical protein